MRSSDWRSDVCASDLAQIGLAAGQCRQLLLGRNQGSGDDAILQSALAPPLQRLTKQDQAYEPARKTELNASDHVGEGEDDRLPVVGVRNDRESGFRSDENTSELQSLMRISYAVF